MILCMGHAIGGYGPPNVQRTKTGFLELESLCQCACSSAKLPYRFSVARFWTSSLVCCSSALFPFNYIVFTGFRRDYDSYLSEREWLLEQTIERNASKRPRRLSMTPLITDLMHPAVDKRSSRICRFAGGWSIFNAPILTHVCNGTRSRY